MTEEEREALIFLLQSVDALSEAIFQNNVNLHELYELKQDAEILLYELKRN